MMLSYHGAEHYNSVRDNSARMPPPPPPSKETSLEEKLSADFDTMESEMDVGEGKNQMEVDEANKGDENRETEAEILNRVKPPKKSAPCPCGSGLKYRKCCLDSAKRKKRIHKWKTEQDHDNVAMEDIDDENKAVLPVMEGGFRVLKI